MGKCFPIISASRLSEILANKGTEEFGNLQNRKKNAMEPPKRKAHKNAAILSLLRPKTSKTVLVKAPKTVSACTQTEALKSKTEDQSNARKFARPKPALGQLRKVPEPSLEQHSGESENGTARHKASQTQRIAVKRGVPDSPLDILNVTMAKRRRMTNEVDRARLKKLLEEINNDPPPSWHTASLMWLDVDVLERRIEEYEQEEAASKRQKPERD